MRVGLELVIMKSQIFGQTLLLKQHTVQDGGGQNMKVFFLHHVPSEHDEISLSTDSFSL